METIYARLVGVWILLIASVSFAEQEGMMHGDGWGSGWMGGSGGMGHYGGIWMPILLVIVIAALVMWIVNQKRK